jgi:hypothetical protein
MGQAASGGYYEEGREGQILREGRRALPGAHRCWTGAMQSMAERSPLVEPGGLNFTCPGYCTYGINTRAS